jgi:hypothetical protein
MNTDKSKCASIYWNLLELLDRFESLDSTSYIRELMETERCDNFNDLTQIRKDVESHIGSTAFSRILRKENYSEDLTVYSIQKQEDEERANGALMHYHYWHRKNILKCLPFHYRVYYETFYQTAKLGVILGLFGGAIGSYKWVKKNTKKKYIY